VPGSEGESLSMVSGTSCHHSFSSFVSEHGEFVHHPADLERSGALQIFSLEHYRTAASFAEVS
jgi:hypothetical protein